MGKSIFASRMIWVNSIILAAGIAGFVAGHEVIADHPQIIAVAGAIQGALNIILRLVTTRPIK